MRPRHDNRSGVRDTGALGFGLDRWWKTSPWITVIGAFLGLGLGMSQVLRLARRIVSADPSGAAQDFPDRSRRAATIPTILFPDGYW